MCERMKLTSSYHLEMVDHIAFQRCSGICLIFGVKTVEITNEITNLCTPLIFPINDITKLLNHINILLIISLLVPTLLSTEANMASED